MASPSVPHPLISKHQFNTKGHFNTETFFVANRREYVELKDFCCLTGGFWVLKRSGPYVELRSVWKCGKLGYILMCEKEGFHHKVFSLQGIFLKHFDFNKIGKNEMIWNMEKRDLHRDHSPAYELTGHRKVDVVLI